MKNFCFIVVAMLFLVKMSIYGQVNWQSIQLPLEGEINDIAYSFSNTNVIYISFYHSGYSLYKTTDGGNNWEEKTLPPGLDQRTILIVDPTNSDKIYAKEKLYDESVYRSLDGGDSWIELNTPSGEDFLGFDISSIGVLYGIQNGDVYKSTDDGNSWSIIGSATPAYYNLHCAPSNEDIIYLVSAYNIVKSTDGGISWNIVYTFTDYDPWLPKFIIHPLDPNTIVVVKDSTLITNDGFASSSWIDEDNILSINLNSIIYKSTKYGLFKSFDYGGTWLQASNSGLVYFDLLEINPNNPQEMLANSNYNVTLDGAGLLKTTSGGSFWFQIFGVESPYIRDFDVSYSVGLLFMTNYEGIFQVSNLNDNWEWQGPDFSSGDFIIHPFNENYQIIIDDELSIITVNSGVTWQEKSPVPDSDWDYALMSTVDPPIIFAWDRGSYQLFRTQDMCDTWETLSIPQGNIEFVRLSTNNSSVVFLNDNNTIYKSYNMGTDWSPISFPENISQTPIGPFIPLNTSDTQFYFGYNTDIWQYSVIKSTDNSKNFTINHCNFPESIYSVDDVVFNPSNENEMFGLYSGSLIASGNCGVDWQLLNNPLGVGNSIESIYYYPANYDTLITETEEGWFKGDISSILSVIDEEQSNNLPNQTKLLNNYPNPFNPVTTISFKLPKYVFVNLSIYNLAGQLVETLVNEQKNAGYYSVEWNAKNVSSGIYFYRIDAGEFSSVKKCLIVK